MEKHNSNLIENIRKNLKEKFPCHLIPRKKIAEATGGILHPRTMANEDSLKKGIANPIMVKGHVCYRVENVLEYLFKNMKDVIAGNGGKNEISN